MGRPCTPRYSSSVQFCPLGGLQTRGGSPQVYLHTHRYEPESIVIRLCLRSHRRGNMNTQLDIIQPSADYKLYVLLRSMVPDLQHSISFFRRFPGFTYCPSVNSNMQTTTHWCNDTHNKPNYSDRNLSLCHSVHHHLTWNDLGLNPGLSGRRPATVRAMQRTPGNHSTYSSHLT